jgi:hypothetical protein
MSLRNGIKSNEAKGNWVFASDDNDKSNSANSFMVDSSIRSIFFGRLDNIPAPTIKALFLKKEHTC